MRRLENPCVKNDVYTKEQKNRERNTEFIEEKKQTCSDRAACERSSTLDKFFHGILRNPDMKNALLTEIFQDENTMLARDIETCYEDERRRKQRKDKRFERCSESYFTFCTTQTSLTKRASDWPAPVSGFFRPNNSLAACIHARAVRVCAFCVCVCVFQTPHETKRIFSLLRLRNYLSRPSLTSRICLAY